MQLLEEALKPLAGKPEPVSAKLARESRAGNPGVVARGYVELAPLPFKATHREHANR